MRKLKHVLAATIASMAIASTAILAGASPSLAWLHAGSTTQYPPQGGTWTYGFWNVYVRSYYYHPSDCHGSTADFWDGSQWRRARSLDTQPNYTSVAEVGGYNLWYTDDRYYYRWVESGLC